MNDTMHDRSAERATLAACLVSKTARQEARRHVTGKDFWEPAHEAIWDALARLDRDGKSVDPVTLLRVVKADRAAVEILPGLVTSAALPDHVGEYAETVRSWAIKRRIDQTAREVQQHALDPDANAVGYAASVANQFAAIRDSGLTDDVTAKTLSEVLAEPDDEPDWLIPGLLERQDRLIITGDEGLGKSHLLRQFAICASAGLHPWDAAIKFDPIKTAIFDCENTERQVRRMARGMVGFAARYGRNDVADRVNVRCSARLDITRDKDLALIHRELDAQQPDLVVIGPLYRLVPRAIQTDDDAAPVLAALDTIRDRGIALLIEAHSGHAIGKGGNRDMRPRGSSALLGWPEFGYGLRDIGTQGKRFCEFIAWRGNRSERDWPRALKRADDGVRWIPYDGPIDVGNAWGAA
jgi:replicative DNA helicase